MLAKNNFLNGHKLLFSEEVCGSNHNPKLRKGAARKWVRNNYLSVGLSAQTKINSHLKNKPTVRVWLACLKWLARKNNSRYRDGFELEGAPPAKRRVQSGE